MKRFFGYTILLILLFFAFFSFSQNREIELREKIKTSKDTSLISAYLDLAKYYYQTTGKGDSLIRYSHKALKLSKELNSSRHELEAYKYSGVGYLVTKEFDKSEVSFESSLNLAIKINDLKSQADLYNKLGTLYQNSGQQVLAVQNLIKAAQYSEKIEDYKNVAQAYYGISLIYNEEGQLDKQLDYIERAIITIENKDINDPLMKNIIWGYASQQYVELYKKNKDKNYLNLIYRCANEALDLANKNNFESRKISSYNVLSAYYFFIKDYVNHEFYTKEVLKNRHLAKEDVTINAFFNLANIYKSRNQKTLTYAYLDTLNSLKIKSEAYYGSRISNFSYNAYKYFNDANLALKALEEKDVFDRELNDIERNKSINDIEAKYKTELKDAEINKKQVQINRLITFFITAVLILISILFISKMIELKKERKQKEAIKLAFEKQIQLEKELTDVRDEIAQDFHDDLGNKLARISLLTNLISGEVSINNPKVKSKIKQITEDANGLYIGTRDFIFSLKSNSDYIEEVATYLTDFGEDFFKKTKVKFSVTKEISENIKLPHYWNKQLIFIFKEALTNALKHALADTVLLSFIYHENKLIVKCSDNGKGITKEAMNSTNGLLNMKKRAAKIGGILKIDSEIGNGTIIRFTGNTNNV